jgi:hypothetical protein
MLPYLVSNKETKNQLQIIQNKCLKSILGIPTRTNTNLTHSVLKMNRVDKRLKDLSKNYINNASLFNRSVKQLIDKHSNTQCSISILNKIEEFNQIGTEK